MNDPELGTTESDDLGTTWAPVDRREGGGTPGAPKIRSRPFGFNRSFTSKTEDPVTSEEPNPQQMSDNSEEEVWDGTITVEIDVEDKEEEYQLDCDIDFIRLISRLTQQHCPADWETLSRRDIQKFESQINSKLQKYKETFLDEHASQIAKMKSAQAAPPITPTVQTSTRFQADKKKQSTPLFGYKKRDK